MTQIQKFRFINKIEGLSFLILLFIAMPLKYIFGYLLATKIVGMVHGVLVIVFLYQLLRANEEEKLGIKKSTLYTILSLIPFGSFYTDKLLKNIISYRKNIN